MPRKKGSLNKPSEFAKATPKMSPEEIAEVKKGIIELLTNGTCATIAAAARKLDINPRKISSWAYTDPDFKQAKEAAMQIVADDLEEYFKTHKNFIPQMMLLKTIRPQYRDNYKSEQASGALEKLLTELAKLATSRLTKAPELPAPSQEAIVDLPFTVVEVQPKEIEAPKECV